MKMLRHARLGGLLAATLSAACWMVGIPLRADDTTHVAAATPAAANPGSATAAANPASKMLRDAALMLLKEGNDRYVAGKPQHPNLSPERRSSTDSGGQEPFASILACSDSRGPVELLFDRGVGDLFVIRVAGNITGESELASLEYGVGHLNTPVLVVLGHSKCGAVTAVTKGAELHGHLHALAEFIGPAAEKARTEATDPNDLVPRAIQANVWNMVERILRDSSVIRERAASGAVHLVGAIYDLESGKVNWLGGHPAQDAIIALANQATTDAALANSKESFAPDGHAQLHAPAPGATPAKAGTATSRGASTPALTKPAKGLAAGGHPEADSDSKSNPDSGHGSPAPKGHNH